MQTKDRHCPRCNQAATAESERCIFCWAPLGARPVRWRHVYHAANSIDAWLAKSALESHGVCARIRDEHAARLMLQGHSNTVVEAAEGDHWLAQEVLRQVRGVRTDTEFLEWQELKRRRSPQRKILMGAMTLLAAAAAALVTGSIVSHFSFGKPAPQSVTR